MKIKGWIAGALIAGGGVLAMRGCLSRPDPDAQLAAQFSALCDIARDNIATPERGVRALGRYLGKHLGDITGELGDTIAMIEKISDDHKHDARARVARDRIRRPVNACEREWMEFSDAVSNDPKASALIEEASVRLSRTFEILFGGGAVDLRKLPVQIEHALDAI